MAASAADSKARAKYVSDIHKQAATVAKHGASLQKNAPQRIAKAEKLLKGAHGGGASDLISHTHAVERMLHEVAFYPPHDVRKESPAYSRVHHEMVRDKDLPCLACGVRQSTLNDPEKNPFGAVQMETHHHVIEWALANAIDPDKFNTHVLPGLLRKNPEKYTPMKDGMTRQQILDWVDHDKDNLWVLCDVHHRHVYVGIHAITFPIWGPQDLLNAELLGKFISQAAGAGKSKKAVKKRSVKKKSAKKKAVKKTRR